MSFSQATSAIGDIVTNDSIRQSVLRSRPLERLRKLSDAIEAYVARPGRPRLLPSEESELTNVRYIRAVEEGIAVGDFKRMSDSDYPSDAGTEDREKWLEQVRERERVERERVAPTLEEAQRDIFRHFMPGKGKN